MYGGTTKMTVLNGVHEIPGCLYALIKNQGVGTAFISINDSGVRLSLEPGSLIVVYNGLVPSNLKLNVKSESSDDEIILISTEIIC